MKSNNPWKHVKPADVSRNKYVHEELDKPPTPDPSKPESSPITGSYLLLPGTNTYSLGVKQLQDQSVGNATHPRYQLPNSKVSRALTFKENLQARLEDYNKLTDSQGQVRDLASRLQLWNEWLDSCSGIAYPSEFQKGTGKFKLVTQSAELITIAPDFVESFLSCDYDSLNGTELDSSKGKYNELLTQSEIKTHEGWLTVVEGDSKLLEDYVDTLFSILQERDANKQMPARAMGFYLRSSTTTAELRALFVYYLDNLSSAYGLYNLNYNGSFLLVAPSQKISTRNKGRTK